MQETHRAERCFCKPLEQAMLLSTSQKQFCTFQGALFRLCLWHCKLGGTLWRSTGLKDCEIDVRERKWEKKLHTFLSLHTSVRVWFLVQQSMLQPFLFPTREVDYQHTAAPLRRVKPERTRVLVEWGFSVVLCVVFFFFHNRQYKIHRRGRSDKAGSQLQ